MKSLILVLCAFLFSLLQASIQRTNTDSAYKRLLKADATLKLDLVDCKAIVTVDDKTIFYDSSNVDSVDFIVGWRVDWGDGSQLVKIERKKKTDLGIKDLNIAHSYNKRENFVFKYYIETKKGLKDTFVSNIVIPGPQPSFKFESTNNSAIQIGVSEYVRFINTTKKMTSSAAFNFFFGDGAFVSIRGNPPDGVKHYYSKV